MTTQEQPFGYRFLSIDEECEKWANGSSNTDSPPCFTILSQFYHELMIPAFPLEEERDDLDDWFECFHFQIKQIRWRAQKQTDYHTQELSDEEKLLLQGNAMDVVLIIADSSTREHEKETPAQEMDSSMSSFVGLHAPNSTKTDTISSVIIGAAAVEYYKQSRVGLLSYIVLHPDFRGRGLAAPLHEEALFRLNRLAFMYGKSEIKPLMQAIFAETNTAAAGDVTPEQSLLRHKSLYKLGYRLVNFPYAQPPLCTKDADASFDDLLLLVYFPFNEDFSERNAAASIEIDTESFYPWYKNKKTAPVLMDINIPFCYVEDFYKSVFGYSSYEEGLAHRDDIDGIPDYRTAKYFKLAEWFSRHPENSGLVEVSLNDPPWEDCKKMLYAKMFEWQESTKD